MSFDIAQYREMFLEEANELLENIDEILLAAENNGTLSSDEMGSLFRAMHTLKGSGASVELKFLTKFAHETENFMDQLRNNKIAWESDMASLLIDCTDALREILEIDMKDGMDDGKFDEMAENLIAQLKAYMDGNAPAPKAEAPKSDKVEGYGDNFGFFDEELHQSATTSATPTAASSANLSLEELEEIGYGWFEHIVAKKPNITSATSEKTPVVQEFAPKAPKEEIAPTIAPRVASPAKEKEDGEKKEGGGATSSNAATIRVNLDKIDTLMNNVGELVITNAMLAQFAQSIDNDKIRDAISERLELLNRHTRELQESIMSIRMVPMENIYSKFPKVVRDVSKKLGKKIEFKHFGDNVEIDKAMIEGLTDPLMHIIRNSLDHGIEMPADRTAAHKSDTGTITIGAEQSNGQMIITIDDDGKGIDTDRVVAKAIERGILDEGKVSSMSNEDKALLIFEAGLSTAEKITDISGRGVGMDVVKTNITKLGGVIKIETEMGIGTRITIILPLTLAILDGLDVAVGDKRYILPLSTILESLQPKPSMIKRIGNGKEELLMLREEFIPIVRLYHLFGVEPTFKELHEGMLIVVKSGSSKVALFVDEFLNQHQVVVKPLDKNFRNVQGIGAATVRGDGSIGLILDVLGIIEEQRKAERRAS